MKRKHIKECIIFVVVAVIAAVAIIATAKIGTQKYYPLEGDDSMQILFLGDSNFAYNAGDKSIPQRIGERLNATIYNCAIGGTTATKLNTSNYFDADLDMFDLYNLSKVMVSSDYQSLYAYHSIGGDFGKETVRKAEMLVNIDLNQMDYIVLAYGLNDYTSGCAIYGEDPYDETTYIGALRSSVERIHEVCPDTKIILSSITYCVFYDNNEVIKDGYEMDYGGGTIDEYLEAMEIVAEEYHNVFFINNLENMDIDKENYMDYLYDEMHFNVAGQENYVNSFIHEIEKIESATYE